MKAEYRKSLRQGAAELMIDSESDQGFPLFLLSFSIDRHVLCWEWVLFRGGSLEYEEASHVVFAVFDMLGEEIQSMDVCRKSARDGSRGP